MSSLYIKIVHTTLVLALSLLIFGCGGGGGNDTDFAGAGQVDLKVFPSVIDTGDRTLVSVKITNRHQDGVILKIRFPLGLSYVPESSKITINGKELSIDPSAIEKTDQETYLVYFLDTEFGSSKDGIVSFQLRGVDVVNKQDIEVDLDVLDVAKFDVNDPEFTPEDSHEITVEAEQ